MKLQLPEGLTLENFLGHYWQKRPLLMRGALDDYDFPLAPDELAGMACEEGVESRLVIGRSRTEWELHHGPFDESYFTALPERNWTLLLQDVDKYLPEVAELLDPFRFISSWRFDDVMVSYAVAGGSVGPHIDTYDVFLVQGRGSRRWQISTRPEQNELLPDLPIRILAEFEPEQEWLVERGDVLYLPPGVAHWGIAEGECMSWSVGLRAPSEQEMLDSFTQFLLERMPESGHYRDPPLKPCTHPARIGSAPLQQTFSQLDHWLRDEELRRRWFGCFVTEVKSHLAIKPAPAPIQPNELQQRLQRGACLQRHPFARFAWMEMSGGEPLLFACGEFYNAPKGSARFLDELCSAPWLEQETLSTWLEDPSCAALLCELFNLGYLEFVDD